MAAPSSRVRDKHATPRRDDQLAEIGHFSPFYGLFGHINE
jgi:hypothetical protein